MTRFRSRRLFAGIAVGAIALGCVRELRLQLILVRGRRWSDALDGTGRFAHLEDGLQREHAGSRPRHLLRGRRQRGRDVGVRRPRRLQAELARLRARAGRQLEHVGRRQDVHVQAAPGREVPRRHRRDGIVVASGLQAPHRGQQRAGVHARRRHLDQRTRPAHVRGAPRQAGQRVPRLPGRAVRTEGREPGDPDRARGQGLRPELVEGPRRRNRSVHHLQVHDRPGVRAHPLRRLLGLAQAVLREGRDLDRPERHATGVAARERRHRPDDPRSPREPKRSRSATRPASRCSSSRCS